MSWPKTLLEKILDSESRPGDPNHDATVSLLRSADLHKTTMCEHPLIFSTHKVYIDVRADSSSITLHLEVGLPRDIRTATLSLTSARHLAECLNLFLEKVDQVIDNEAEAEDE